MPCLFSFSFTSVFSIFHDFVSFFFLTRKPWFVICSHILSYPAINHSFSTKLPFSLPCWSCHLCIPSEQPLLVLGSGPPTPKPRLFLLFPVAFLDRVLKSLPQKVCVDVSFMIPCSPLILSLHLISNFSVHINLGLRLTFLQLITEDITLTAF